MKNILALIVISAVSLHICKCQPILLKQYEREGSCWQIKSITYNFNPNKTTVHISVYMDYQTMAKNINNYSAIHDFQFDGLLIDTRDSCINWALHNQLIFKGAQKTSVQNAPVPPDTTWVNISAMPSDTSIHRKIGVYKTPDDIQIKSCYIEGVAKYYRNDSLINSLTQTISWTLDNWDSVKLGNTWMKSYNAIKYLKSAYGWTDTETIIHGVQFFDPLKINDRIK